MGRFHLVDGFELLLDAFLFLLQLLFLLLLVLHLRLFRLLEHRIQVILHCALRELIAVSRFEAFFAVSSVGWFITFSLGSSFFFLSFLLISGGRVVVRVNCVVSSSGILVIGRFSYSHREHFNPVIMNTPLPFKQTHSNSTNTPQ